MGSTTTGTGDVTRTGPGLGLFLTEHTQGDTQFCGGIT